MGVNIFLLDRRLARLRVGGFDHEIGSLRRFWKITEWTQERADELKASEAVSSAMPSPRAAMVVDVIDIPTGSATGPGVRAHRVIGWDQGRTKVTDMNWDYLPTLGYAVRDPDSMAFVLHEMRDGALHRLDRERAVELGLIDQDGQLKLSGQPTIAECTAVRHYIDGYAQADCIFDDGRHEKLLFGVSGKELPDTAWLAGKKPMQVEYYPSQRRSGSATFEPQRR